jgi:hypothetical protein
MRVSVSRNRGVPTVSISYFSSSGRSGDVASRLDALLLRNAICQVGEFCPVVAISEKGLANSQLSFICIPRTVSIIGANCFERSDASFFAFDGPRATFCPLEVFWQGFSNCGLMSSLCLSSDLEIIPGGSFQLCRSLRIVRFEANSRLIHIDAGGLSGCSSLESIVIPSSVRFLCSGCFEDCTWLQNVVIETGSNLIQIGSDAFARCNLLRWFYLPPLVHTIEGGAFCSSGICEVQVGEGSVEIPPASKSSLSQHSLARSSCRASHLEMIQNFGESKPGYFHSVFPFTRFLFPPPSRRLIRQHFGIRKFPQLRLGTAIHISGFSRVSF